MGLIDPKWDKSETFKISFSTFWLAESKYVLKLILKSPRFVQFANQNILKVILKVSDLSHLGTN